MAVRPYWKGHLKLSLVNCAVQMMPATSESEKVRFHTLNAPPEPCRQSLRGFRHRQGRKGGERGQGYARGENDYVVLEEDELENVALDSTRTIDISTFTERDTIEWIWLDTPYYLSPSEKVAQEAFAVIRDAMASQDMVGISDW